MSTPEPDQPDKPESKEKSPRGWGAPGRRWLWAAAVVVLLALVAAFAIGWFVGRPYHHRVSWQDGGPGPHGRMHIGHGGDGPIRGHGGPLMREHWGPDGRHEPGERGRFMLQGGGPSVVGTVASVDGANVVVNTDGGGPVTVNTDDRTRVRGSERREVSDLRPGDRVVAVAEEGRPAKAIVVPRAHAAGTVTSVEGDRITLTEPGGLTRTVDISGVTSKPGVGDQVSVRGTQIDNGATLRAESISIRGK